MNQAIRTMKRSEWEGIEERAYADMPFQDDWFCGRAGILYMKRVEKPFYVRSFGKRLQITGTDYAWVQLAPENGHYWATVMFNEKGELFQYYFDITLENRLRGDGGSEFTDLYLDVVMSPDGRLVRLDAEELENALREGKIDRAAYELAIDSEKALTALLDGNENRIRRVVNRAREMLLKKL